MTKGPEGKEGTLKARPRGRKSEATSPPNRVAAPLPVGVASARTATHADTRAPRLCVAGGRDCLRRLGGEVGEEPVDAKFGESVTMIGKVAVECARMYGCLLE